MKTGKVPPMGRWKPGVEDQSLERLSSGFDFARDQSGALLVLSIFSLVTHMTNGDNNIFFSSLN